MPPRERRCFASSLAARPKSAASSRRAFWKTRVRFERKFLVRTSDAPPAQMGEPEATPLEPPIEELRSSARWALLEIVFHGLTTRSDVSVPCCVGVGEGGAPGGPFGVECGAAKG
jgi:hypothetical protein